MGETVTLLPSLREELYFLVPPSRTNGALEAIRISSYLQRKQLDVQVAEGPAKTPPSVIGEVPSDCGVLVDPYVGTPVVCPKRKST
jgi:hypothetical protein